MALFDIFKNLFGGGAAAGDDQVGEMPMEEPVAEEPSMVEETAVPEVEVPAAPEAPAEPVVETPAEPTPPETPVA